MSLTLVLGAAAQVGTFHAIQDGRASISGRVLDASGNPCPAEVRAFQIAILQGFAHMFSKCETKTNQEGAFECPKLQEGKFIVQAEPLRPSGKQAPKAQDPAVGNIPPWIFSPGVTDLEQAIPISLRNNEAGWAEVRVSDATGVEVTGTLSEHVQGAFLMLKAQSGLLTVDTEVRPQYDSKTGRFVLSNVPAGHYQLTAAWPANGEERFATLPLVVDAAPVNNLVLSGASNVEINGHISALPPGVKPAQVMLKSTDGSTHDLYASLQGGAFHLHAIPAGEYVLSFPSGQQGYVDAVSIGGKPGGSRFTVLPGQGIMNLEVDVKGPGVPIRGSVQEWQGPAVQAEVIAQSEDSGEIYKVTTDEKRNFSIPGVKPGEYRLFASPGENAIEYRNPLVLSKYSKDSTEVSVDENGIAGAIELSPIE